MRGQSRVATRSEGKGPGESSVFDINRPYSNCWSNCTSNLARESAAAPARHPLESGDRGPFGARLEIRVRAIQPVLSDRAEDVEFDSEFDGSGFVFDPGRDNQDLARAH